MSRSTGAARPDQERAHAKINLFLHVTGRRDDGYHLLDSLAVFAGAHDVLHAVPVDAGFPLQLSGRFGEGLRLEQPSDNLVVRAANGLERLRRDGQGAALRLEKNLPVASGIGGGSADAAAVLRLLDRMWRRAGSGAGPEAAALDRLALSLGADVPVCLRQQPARMGGVGEVLSPAPRLPPCGMVLVNCGIGVSTPAVFRARRPGFRPPAVLPDAWRDAASMCADLAGLHNDLEAPAIGLCPAIGEVLRSIRAVPDCLLARMSGSGATCFGLFADPVAAERAPATLARTGWWVWGGAVL